MRNPLFLLATVSLIGCASTNAEPGFRAVAATVKARTGHEPQWNRNGAAEAAIDQTVHRLLATPLTASAAVHIALLRNPALQATYEEISLAQADVVQAGLLSNPVLSADVTTAEREAIDPNLILGLTQSFLDLLLIPAKTKIAASAFEEAKYRVGNAVLDLVTEVQKAFYAVVAGEQILAMRRTVAESEQASAELYRAQRDAGSVNDLAVANEDVLYQQAQLDVASAEVDLVSAKERLTRLMGLWGPEVAWRSVDRLPDVPPGEAPLEHLESRAVADRLDLAALRQEVQTLKYALHLSQSSRWTGLIDIGVDVARLKDGNIAVGPRGSIELPVFDQRRATIARLEAQLRASEQLLAARTIEIRSEVRDLGNRLLYAHQVIERFRTEIIPTRERLVALSQQQYGAMLLGVYQLIAAKQNEVNAYRGYIEAVRDYWSTRAELDRAIGGRVSTTGDSRAPAPTPVPTEAPPPHQHQHS